MRTIFTLAKYKYCLSPKICIRNAFNLSGVLQLQTFQSSQVKTVKVENSCQNAFWDRLVTNMAADLKLQGQKTSGDSRTNGGGDLCNIPCLRLPKLLGYGIIALTSLTCYMNSLDYDLVHDDVFAIKENSDVRPDTSLYNLFMNDFWGKPMWSNTSHKSYRPLCALTFRMNYMIHGLNPFGYHAVNIILHCMVSLLYTLMCDVVAFKSSVLALFAGLLFTTHPVHTEAVSKRLSILLIPLYNQSLAPIHRRTFHVLNLKLTWVDPNDISLIFDSSVELYEMGQFIFTMYNDLHLLTSQNKLCGSKNYPYLPHGRDFPLDPPPTPLEIPVKLHTFT